MRNRLILVPLLLAAACSKPLEGKVADRLAAAGLPEPMARCMAERWTDRLSVLQLNKIAGVAERLRDQQGRLTIIRFVESVNSLDDAEIKQVVTRSSVLCALTS